MRGASGQSGSRARESPARTGAASRPRGSLQQEGRPARRIINMQRALWVRTRFCIGECRAGARAVLGPQVARAHSFRPHSEQRRRKAVSGAGVTSGKAFTLSVAEWPHRASPRIASTLRMPSDSMLAVTAVSAAQGH